MMNDIRRDPEATARVRLVSSFYERLGKGDVPGVLALLDPQVKWTEAERFPYHTGTWIGPQAVLDNLLKRLAADWDAFAATPKDYLSEGTRVVSFGTYSGIYRRTGKSMRSDFAHVWTVEHGKITSFLMYTDTAKVLDDLTTTRADHIPGGCIWIDNPWQSSYDDSTFNPSAFADPKGMIDQARALGFEVVNWSTPYLEVAATPPANLAQQLFVDAKARGYFVTMASDGALFETPASVAGSTHVGMLDLP